MQYRNTHQKCKIYNTGADNAGHLKLCKMLSGIIKKRHAGAVSAKNSKYI
mgnify:CR=1 FL=1